MLSNFPPHSWQTLLSIVIVKRQWQTKTTDAIKMILKEYAMMKWTVANILIYEASNIYLLITYWQKVIVLFDSHIPFSEFSLNLSSVKKYLKDISFSLSFCL